MFKNFLDSAKNLNDLRKFCATALLVAVYVALYAVKIPLNDQLRITFTFLPVAVCGWLFGAVPGVIVSAIGDVLGCLFFPQGAYFYGYTVTAVFTGLVFGLCLYKTKENRLLLCVILSKLLVTLFLNIGLNSFWATFFVPKSFWVIMSGKLIKNFIMLPIEVALLYAVIKALLVANIQKMYK